MALLIDIGCEGVLRKFLETKEEYDIGYLWEFLMAMETSNRYRSERASFSLLSCKIRYGNSVLEKMELCSRMKNFDCRTFDTSSNSFLDRLNFVDQKLYDVDLEPRLNAMVKVNAMIFLSIGTQNYLKAEVYYEFLELFTYPNFGTYGDLRRRIPRILVLRFFLNIIEHKRAILNQTVFNAMYSLRTMHDKSLKEAVERLHLIFLRRDVCLWRKLPDLAFDIISSFLLY